MTVTTKHPVIRKDVVRIVCLAVPKEGIPFEDFDTYWLNTHGPLWASLPIVKKNLTKYEQFHYAPAADSKLTEVNLPILNQTPYRGIVTLEAESYDKITEIFTDPEYLERVVPSSHNFFDSEKSVWIGGGIADFFSKPPSKC